MPEERGDEAARSPCHNRQVLSAQPRRKLAVVTCMDARIEPLAAFELELGDAHVLRNAGGLVTDDVLRSLAISQRALGTTDIAVMHHTGCGMSGFDDAAFRATLAEESGRQPEWDVPGFDDVAAQVRRSVELVRACPWLPHREAVRGYVFDVAAQAVQATI
jgi:carbonic anhydrase